MASPTVKEREDDVMQYEAAVGQRSLGDFWLSFGTAELIAETIDGYDRKCVLACVASITSLLLAS